MKVYEVKTCSKNSEDEWAISEGMYKKRKNAMKKMHEISEEKSHLHAFMIMHRIKDIK